MEQTNKNYPRFERGQVLTSEALNSYFGYLDEQERLTRAQLLGIGIINGLDFQYNDGVIYITKGTSVTCDGSLIELDSDTPYTVAVEYSDGMLSQKNPLSDSQDDNFSNTLQHVSFVLYKDTNDAQLHGQVIQAQDHPLPNQEEMENYILALSVDFISQDDVTKCNELSCDIIQTDFRTEIRPILINKNIFENNTQLAWFLANFQYHAQPDTSLKLAFSSTNKNKDGAFVLDKPSIDKAIEKKYKEFSSFIDSLFSFYNMYISNMGDLLGMVKHTGVYILVEIFTAIFGGKPNTIKADTPTPAWMMLIDNPQESFSRLINAMDKIQKASSENIPDYYILHLNDILIAIDEFTIFYNEFAGKYNMLPISNTNYNRLVMLGAGSNSICNSFRHYNNSFLRTKQFQADRVLLEKHLMRIIVLSENFISKEDYLQLPTHIKCIRQKKHAKLGERIIPDYYRPNAYWNAHSNFNVMRFRSFESIGNVGNDKAAALKSIFDDLNYDHIFSDEKKYRVESENSDLLILQGYYGQKYTDVKHELDSYITSNSLNIKVTLFHAVDTTTLNNYITELKKYREKFLDLYDNYRDVFEQFTTSFEWEGAINCILDSTAVDITLLRNVYKGFMHGNKRFQESNFNLPILSSMEQLLHAYVYSSYYLQNITMIGGCPNNGELVLFYDDNDNVYLCVGIPNLDDKICILDDNINPLVI